MTASSFRIGGTNTWIVSIPLTNESNDAQSPVALHFVIDNSGSMGSMTQEVKTVFSAMVDSAASGPCSLTLFDSRAVLLSDNITTAKQMIQLPNRSQGATNIPAGVRRAMETITSKELDERARGVIEKTHHILILLTDGGHNTGPTPEREFPKIGMDMLATVPDVQLSVVVVGITRSSSTSMGMSLKTSIETVPLDSNVVENIYFATSRGEMKTVARRMVDGLNTVSKGKVHNIAHPGGCIISDMNSPPQSTVSIRSSPSDSRIAILFESEDAPTSVGVGGENVAISQASEPDFNLIAETLAKHIDKTRVQRVASRSSSTSAVRASVARLNNLVDTMEGEMKKRDGAQLKLAKSSGSERLKQNRLITKTVYLARELRNQLSEVANFETNSSAEQAAFLTGRTSKFASKALRRAANRSGDGVLDPENEMKEVFGELANLEFQAGLESLLRQDIFTNISRLSKDQILHLEDVVKRTSLSDSHLLQRVLKHKEIYRFSEGTCRKESAQAAVKVTTSALCWIPPTGQVHDAVQAIRHKHDRQIKRWPPHVNLLFPFVPASEFEGAAQKLARALSTFAPFEVDLQEIDHFKHGKKSYTAWLHPKQTKEFVALQAICQSIFPHCDDLVSRGAYVPHLTVGQCAKQVEVDALVNGANWKESATNCGEICLISRSGKDDPFEILWRVELGNETPKASLAAVANGAQRSSKKPADTSSQIDRAFDGLGDEVKEFINSGKLAVYLNSAFFGGRQSYLSLSTPWEHLKEWRDLATEAKGFDSQWEMLLYAGSVAYPIAIERSASSQMSPFQLEVTKIHTTAIDTASLSCANHSGIDTYGPEGGEPIKDALVLVDPSCPKASTKIASSRLLGETFTSVVVSRDLHMYTGSSMKVALLGKSLFCCLQPEPVAKSKTDIVAEIQREFLHKAYQCGGCGFGPVDHGGCSDLYSHHGEVDGRGGVASNACPSCGWFSERLSDWEAWDGTVPQALIEERSSKPKNCAPKPLAAKMDLVLRILYTFRKLFFRSQNSIKEFYDALAQRLMDWDLGLTTQDDIEGLVQVLLAAATSDKITDESAVDAVVAPPVMLAVVNEACGRAARKKFRMMALGDEVKTKALAVKHVTAMLHITPESSPETKESLLEAEPSREEVEQNCDRDYTIGSDSDEDREWAKQIAGRWCTVMGLVKALRASILRRGGGWKKLEQDMETSLENYQDVVQDLRNAQVGTVAQMCDLEEVALDRTWTTMAAQAYLYNRGSTRQELPDVTIDGTLRDIARDMRMEIYFGRVREKMAQWKDSGELLAFAEARASDIGQYTGMIGSHAHGLSKEMFWGLWEAAMCDGYGGEKVMAFLEKANEGFRGAHASGGVLTGQSRRKKKK